MLFQRHLVLDEAVIDRRQVTGGVCQIGIVLASPVPEERLDGKHLLLEGVLLARFRRMHFHEGIIGIDGLDLLLAIQRLGLLLLPLLILVGQPAGGPIVRQGQLGRHHCRIQRADLRLLGGQLRADFLRSLATDTHAGNIRQIGLGQRRITRRCRVDVVVTQHVEAVFGVLVERMGAIARADGDGEVRLATALAVQGDVRRAVEAAVVGRRGAAQGSDPSAGGGAAGAAVVEIDAEDLPTGIRGIQNVDQSVAIHVHQRRLGRNTVGHAGDLQVGRLIAASPPQQLAAVGVDDEQGVAARVIRWSVRLVVILAGVVTTGEDEHFGRRAVDLELAQQRRRPALPEGVEARCHPALDHPLELGRIEVGDIQRVVIAPAPAHAGIQERLGQAAGLVVGIQGAVLDPQLDLPVHAIGLGSALGILVVGTQVGQQLLGNEGELLYPGAGIDGMNEAFVAAEEQIQLLQGRAQLRIVRGVIGGLFGIGDPRQVLVGAVGHQLRFIVQDVGHLLAAGIGLRIEPLTPFDEVATLGVIGRAEHGVGQALGIRQTWQRGRAGYACIGGRGPVGSGPGVYRARSRQVFGHAALGHILAVGGR